MCQIFRILLLVLEKLDYIFKKIHSISNKAKKKKYICFAYTLNAGEYYSRWVKKQGKNYF